LQLRDSIKPPSAGPEKRRSFRRAPIVLLHHRGRKSGREYVNPGDLHGGGEQAAEQFEQELTWEVVA